MVTVVVVVAGAAARGGGGPAHGDGGCHPTTCARPTRTRSRLIEARAETLWRVGGEGWG